MISSRESLHNPLSFTKNMALIVSLESANTFASPTATASDTSSRFAKGVAPRSLPVEYSGRIPETARPGIYRGLPLASEHGWFRGPNSHERARHPVCRLSFRVSAGTRDRDPRSRHLSRLRSLYVAHLAIAFRQFPGTCREAPAAIVVRVHRGRV